LTDPTLSLALLGTFESLRMGPTFARGRRDERAGHVRELTVSTSLAVALVRPPEAPAAVRARIAVRSFGAAEWARVEQDLAAEARFAAELLAGRMPAGIEATFAAAGLNLVPLSLDEVAMDCACERWPMPCVHLAAMLYALARKFSEDPFEVFAWRGRGRDELLLHLRELRSATAFRDPHRPAEPGRRDEPDAGDIPADTESLGDPAAFWGGAGAPIGPVAGRPGAASRPDSLLDQLDPPPLSHRGLPIVDVLRPAYRALPEE
jgi:uncharacterized Zn finger protein